MDKTATLKGNYLFQHPFPPYFVDFYIPKYKLAIEVDGSYHKDRKGYDALRTKNLVSKYGIKVIRVKNHDVQRRIERTIERILGYIRRNLQKTKRIKPVAMKCL